MMIDLRTRIGDPRVREEVIEFALEYFGEMARLASRARRVGDVGNEFATLRTRLGEFRAKGSVEAWSDLSKDELEHAILDTAYLTLYGYQHHA